MGFAGRTAVVTGAGGGIGLAVARALAAEGVRVAMLDLKPQPDGMPEGAAYHRIDLTDEPAVGAAFAATGRVDFLVNAAGVLWFGRDRSAIDIDLGLWDRVMAINLKAMVHTARHAVPAMRAAGGGAMVHFSTIQCLRGDPQPQDAYQASKAGVIALSKSLAVQFAKDGIRSNCILPGPTRSPMQERWEGDEAAIARIASRVPLGRVGAVEDQAQACLFLLSDRASFITGTELVVDGGITAMP